MIGARESDAGQDALLPGQLGRRHEHCGGEQRLLMAVMDNGWAAALSKSESERMDAEAWVLGRGVARIEFAYICDVMGLDETAMRERFLAAAGGPEEVRAVLRRRRMRTPVVGYGPHQEPRKVSAWRREGRTQGASG